LLELINIKKSFGAVIALNQASLTLEKGEIVALLGANGSGKSTLVKILGGTVKKDAGTITVDQKPVEIRSSAESRARKIAVAYQELSLIPRMTVYENVMLGHFHKGRFGQVDERKNRSFVCSLLEKYGVACNLDDFPKDLPSSTLSLIEIVKAISWDPDILLLDEVTAALHHNEVENLFSNLRVLSENGISIVMVTHRLSEIFNIASRAVILRNGESVADVDLKKTDINKIVYHMTGKMPEIAENPSDEKRSMEDAVLVVENLSIGESVKNVSLRVNRGEIIGLGGLEGQGQSQFLRSIYGAIPRDSGLITLASKKVDYKSSANAVKDGIGFISGNRNRESIFSLRTIGENIFSAKMSMGRNFSGISNRMIIRQTNQIVKDYEIKIGNINDPITSLSGGNQQKVVFGRWILVSPEILLLDDPTKGVDVSSRRELHNFLRKAADQGMTVLIVSSDNDELLEIANRIYVFYEGGIHCMLCGTDCTEEKLVSAMMGMTAKDSVK